MMTILRRGNLTYLLRIVYGGRLSPRLCEGGEEDRDWSWLAPLFEVPYRSVEIRCHMAVRVEEGILDNPDGKF